VGGEIHRRRSLGKSLRYAARDQDKPLGALSPTLAEQIERLR
jgi:hypothetical protein